MTRSYVCRDSFICVCHDSFICVPWLLSPGNWACNGSVRRLFRTNRARQLTGKNSQKSVLQSIYIVHLAFRQRNATLKRDTVLQKRLIIESILLTVATPYVSQNSASKCDFQKSAADFDRKNPPAPGGFTIYYVPSSRTVSKRTPLERTVPGFSRGVLLHTVLDEGTW